MFFGVNHQKGKTIGLSCYLESLGKEQILSEISLSFWLTAEM